MCSDDLFVNRENLEKENRSNLEVGPTGAIILAYRFSLSGRPFRFERAPDSENPSSGGMRSISVTLIQT